MRSGWTPERRARQAALIRTWRPWDQSTGPRTDEGKTRTACNGDKGGAWRIEREAIRELRQTTNELLRRQRELLLRMTE